jgi:hypothetical protein
VVIARERELAIASLVADDDTPPEPAADGNDDRALAVDAIDDERCRREEAERLREPRRAEADIPLRMARYSTAHLFQRSAKHWARWATAWAGAELSRITLRPTRRAG